MEALPVNGLDVLGALHTAVGDAQDIFAQVHEAGKGIASIFPGGAALANVAEGLERKAGALPPEAAEKARLDAEAKLKSAIAADASATQLVATALNAQAAYAAKASYAQTAPKAKGVKEAVQQSASDVASAQKAATAAIVDSMSIALPPDAQMLRLSAAQTAAAQAAQSTSTLAAKNLATAWAQTVDRLRAAAQLADATPGAAGTPAAAPATSLLHRSESLLQRTIVGPVRVWHALAGVALTGGALFLRRA